MAVSALISVTKAYPGDGTSVAALQDVSLEVEAGEFVAVVGRSGCGKSTLLNLAGAMDFPTSGEAYINGTATASLDDTGLTKLRRTAIGFVFQFFQLLPGLTALENIELPLLLAGETGRSDQALERLRWVEMEGFANRLPHQLSGGQMQRVAIARALVHSPKLILADEPIGNLDTKTGKIVIELLRRAASELGAAVLMATHSRESALGCDAIVRLRDGRISEVERP